jgi:hypothetical protein
LSQRFDISLFSSLVDLWPKRREGLTWPELIAAIGTPRPFLGKGLVKNGDAPVPMFSAAVWERGKSISASDGKSDPNKAAVVGAYFGVWDLDHVATTEAHRVLGALEEQRRAYVYASSFSHGCPASEVKPDKRPQVCPSCHSGGLVKAIHAVGTSWACGYCQHAWTTSCARVVIPFSRMITPLEWPAVWERVELDLFKGVSDPSAKSMVRRYFVPSFKEGGSAPPEHYARHGTGDQTEAHLLDVDAIVGVPDPAMPHAVPRPEAASGRKLSASFGARKLTRDQLKGVAKRLSLNPNKKWIGQAIYALAKGESFAASGNPGRHNTMIRICHEVLDQYEDLDPAAFAQHFAPSLQVMQPTKVTVQEIEKFARWKLAEPRKQYAVKIAEAFAWERSSAYTDDEIMATADAVGARPMEMQHRWIIQCGSSFYVLCNDKYWCYPRDSALSAIRRDLAPHPGIELQTAGRGSMRDKTLDELVRDYGAVAVGVEVNLSAQRAFYDPIRRVMVEAPCPIQVEAEYSAEVDMWFRLLAGPYAERLNLWVACLTRLNEPCVALYLEGGPDTGKSLFMNGIARVYGRRPAELEGALAGFNEEIVLNPVVVADEHLPEDGRGQVRTEAIRKFVQDRERALNRKYRAPATVIGASRVIIAANNHDKLIHTTESLNNHDIAAITERFLVIPAQDAAREYLQRNRAMVKRWGENDTIAKHAVWLCENVEVVPYGRFLVKGEAKAMTNALSTGSGLRAGVCQWVMGLLQRPNTLVNRPGMNTLVRVHDGKLLLTAKVMAEAWNEYIPERASAPPTPSRVSRALAGLSEETTIRLQPSGKTMKMRIFNLEQLATWAEDTNYGDLESIRELVAALDKILNKPQPTLPTPSTVN